MRPLKDQIVPIERLTYEPQHHFFGYYDIQPFSRDLRYHLCHRVGFMNRMQSENDAAELGMIRLYDNAYIPLAETTAWNFQQGSLFQWHPAFPNDKVLYNVNAHGEYKTVIRDVWTGETKLLPMSLATVDPNGRFGLAINFSRIYWFREGYGYAGVTDPFANDMHPKDDGVWRVDFETGEAKLILSLDEMYRMSAEVMKPEELDWKYLINHINLNTDGTRFLALFRGKPADSRPMTSWRTYTITCGSDGSDPYLLLKDVSSHLHWRDPDNVMIYAKDWDGGKFAMYLFRDKTHERFKYDPKDTMPGDGHCSFSPDRKYILNDSYPVDGYRKLFLYDIAAERTILLAQIATQPHATLPHIDMRCDLHPRWSADGSMISFDSVHEGHRHIYRIRMEDLKGVL